MSQYEAYANSYSTTLSAAITDTGATSVSVSVDPPAALGDTNAKWRLLVESEIMLVTAVSGSTLTVTRGAEGTTAATHLDGAVATHILTAGSIQSLGDDPSVFQCRLSLSDTYPVTNYDITGVGTLYLLPYKGKRISLYDGTNWNIYPADLGGSFPTATLAGTSGYLSDIYVYLDSGVLKLDLVDWPQNARGTDLAIVDGIYVSSADNTKRYAGTLCYSADSECSDSMAQRFLWNYYNRAQRILYRAETTASWTYSTSTWRQANEGTYSPGPNPNKVEVAVGVVEDPMSLELLTLSLNSVTGGGAIVSIGINSSTTPAAGGGTPNGCLAGQNNYAAANQVVEASFKMSVFAPTVGYSAFLWLEYGAANGGTITWKGYGLSSSSGIIGYCMA